MRNLRLLTCQCNIIKYYRPILANNKLTVTVNHQYQQRRNFSLRETLESFSNVQISIFKSLSESTPVEYVQKSLLTIHDVTGLPWWASIICTTILARSIITLPLGIYQNYILAKLQNLNPEMVEITNELKKETALAIKQFNWNEATAKHHYRRSVKKQWNKLIVRDNCHPFKASLLIWFQIPTWICFSVSLRNLCYMLPKQDINAQITYTELTIGGFGWIPNLTEIDASLILPFTFGLLNLAIIEIQQLARINNPTKFQKFVTNFARGITIVLIPIAANVPSCLTLYWTTSSAYGLIQNLVLMSPKVKQFCRIPKTALDIEHPYNHVLTKFRHKVNNVLPTKF